MNKLIKIAIGGSEYHSNIVKAILKNESNLEIVSSKKLNDADIIYWIFGRGPSLIKYPRLWIQKKPILIIHWIGTDVLNETNKMQKKWLSRFYFKVWDIVFRYKSNNGGIINFAGAPWLVEELQKVSISSTYVPLTTLDQSTIESHNENYIRKFDFISYVPYNRFEFYGGDKIVNIARRWANYKFLIIHPDVENIPLNYSETMPSNIVFYPHIPKTEMQNLYCNSKFFIRYPKHDGLSLSVLESMFYKMQVLWIYDFPYTIKIKNEKWLSDSIPELINNWSLNDNGHKYVLENFFVSLWKTDFLKALKQIREF